MIARDKNISELFQEGVKQYRVPLFQRSYLWDRSNWGTLWTDIKEKANLRDKGKVKKHFTGIIVTQQDGGNLEIIDGQQRLITFQIILCAIRDVCKVFDNDIGNLATHIKNLIQIPAHLMLRCSQPSDPIERYKLLPRAGFDRDAFQSLVEEEMDERDCLIHEAYGYFKSAIEQYVAGDYDKLDNLYHSILKDFIFVQIEVDSDDEPEKVVQVINNTGQSLNQFDLLRHYLFLRVGTSENRKDLYTRYWHHFDIDENKKDSRGYRQRDFYITNWYQYDINFWQQRGVAEKFLTSFLKAKLNVEKFDDQSSLFDRYQTYHRGLSETPNPNEADLQLVEHEFHELKKYADVYQDIHDPDSEIGSRFKFYDDIGWYISKDFEERVKKFILYIKNELEVSGILLSSVFDFLESLIVRSILCTGQDIGSDPERDLFREMFGRSIFTLLENCLLRSILSIKMMDKDLDRSSRENFDTEDRDLFTNNDIDIFPDPVVEEAMRDCSFRLDSEYEEYGGDTYLDALGTWGRFIQYILHQIELMIAKEKEITEADFDNMCEWDMIRGIETAVSLRKDLSSYNLLREYCPGGIGNLTVCPSLWEENDVWDVDQIRERREKLIAYFNKRWPSIQDCIQPRKRELIQTYRGTRELSHIIVHDTCIEGVDCNNNQRVILDKNHILFACSAAAWPVLKSCVQENEVVKRQELGPIQYSDQKFQVDDQLLRRAADVVAVTRSGHVLKGEVENFNEDVIGMKISGANVLVFKQSLHELETMRWFTVQVRNFVQDTQNEEYGILEFGEVPEEDDERLTRLFGEKSGRIHVHISQCPNEDFHSLQPDQKIDFNIAQTEKGLYARNITQVVPDTRLQRRSRRRRARRAMRS